MTQSSTDENIKVANLQQDIINHLGIAQQNAVFNYKEKDGQIVLDLVTINPKHDQSFLFQSINGTNKSDSLSRMLAYIKSNFEKENTYTMQWLKIGENELHTSYFRAANMYQVLDKFAYNRDLNQYKIFSINLNPMS